MVSATWELRPCISASGRDHVSVPLSVLHYVSQVASRLLSDVNANLAGSAWG